MRHAREILERWQSSDLFEQISSTAPLTSLKQQNRAPLLNIPLGTRTAPVLGPSRVSPTAPSSISRLRSAGTISQVPDSSLWESLIAPPPLLAATAPPLEDHPLVKHYNLPLEALALTKAHRKVEGSHRTAAWRILLDHVPVIDHARVIAAMETTLAGWLAYRDEVADVCGLSR